MKGEHHDHCRDHPTDGSPFRAAPADPAGARGEDQERTHPGGGHAGARQEPPAASRDPRGGDRGRRPPGARPARDHHVGPRAHPRQERSHERALSRDRLADRADSRAHSHPLRRRQRVRHRVPGVAEAADDQQPCAGERPDRRHEPRRVQLPGRPRRAPCCSRSSSTSIPATFFITDRALDFSVVALKGNLSNISKFGWNGLSAAEGKLIVGEYVSIIQHPSGERKQTRPAREPGGRRARQLRALPHRHLAGIVRLAGVQRPVGDRRPAPLGHSEEGFAGPHPRHWRRGVEQQHGRRQDPLDRQRRRPDQQDPAAHPGAVDVRTAGGAAPPAAGKRERLDRRTGVDRADRGRGRRGRPQPQQLDAAACS